MLLSQFWCLMCQISESSKVETLRPRAFRNNLEKKTKKLKVHKKQVQKSGPSCIYVALAGPKPTMGHFPQSEGQLIDCCFQTFFYAYFFIKKEDRVKELEDCDCLIWKFQCKRLYFSYEATTIFLLFDIDFLFSKDPESRNYEIGEILTSQSKRYLWWQLQSYF